MAGIERSSITDEGRAACQNFEVTSDALVRTVGKFLAEARDAVVMEDGAVAFDLAQARYALSDDHHKCLLHLWSSERNIVRRVVEVELRNDVLRLAVQRLGQTKPTKLEICRQRDRRTPTAKKAARAAYQRALERVLQRRFAGFSCGRLTSAMDLERSFGPIYARGLLRQGQTAFAVMGVNAEETQASIDAALTFGVLWLDTCRQTQAGKCLVRGLKLFLPAQTSALTRERMAHLDREAAKWQLYEFDQREDALREVDVADRGNVETRLVHAADETAAMTRFAEPIAYIRQLMQHAETALLSPTELAFRCHGLEFARARLAHEPGSFRSAPELVFGLGAEERVLDDRNAPDFVRLVASIGEVRHPEGPRDHMLWRLHPERWLESLVTKDVSALDERLDPACLYSQVPAFSASDRAMLDVLTTTRQGRMAVIELKAKEDIHLPLQGLDYWSRVEWHRSRGEFQRFGYFPGHELSDQPPLLFLVAPALHVHPATDTLLRYVSPEIPWELIGIDERWREGVRVVFRKRGEVRRSLGQESRQPRS